MAFNKSDMRLGYELECGVQADRARDEYGDTDYKTSAALAKRIGYKIGFDGSIHCDMSNVSDVELKSKVYQVSNLKRVFADFDRMSVRVKETNRTMGLHIHVSFSDHKFYDYLRTYHFVKLFQEAYKNKFRTKRERGRIHNDYCAFCNSNLTFSREQRRGCGNRHRAINFEAIQEHGTIEFRIFPATHKSSKFKTYVNFLTDFIYHYINSMMDLEVKLAQC
jgi:hypothetical protein